MFKGAVFDTFAFFLYAIYRVKAMSIIQKEIKLVGTKGKAKELALFDGGATYSCITPEVAHKIEIVLRLPEPMHFGTAQNGHKVTAKECVRLNFYMGKYRFSDEFMIIPHLSEKVIIGAATLQKWRMKLDFEHDEVIIDPRVTKLRLL